MHHSCLTYVPHVSPISILFIWSPDWCLFRSTNHNALHYLVFSSPLLSRPFQTQISHSAHYFLKAICYRHSITWRTLSCLLVRNCERRTPLKWQRLWIRPYALSSLKYVSRPTYTLKSFTDIKKLEANLNVCFWDQTLGHYVIWLAEETRVLGMFRTFDL